jgi:hypothetical protein
MHCARQVVRVVKPFAASGIEDAETVPHLSFANLNHMVRHVLGKKHDCMGLKNVFSVS